MPIYAYRCDACGFTKDVLQKVSDAPLTECPSCHQASFKKQLTAAGFQLKGTGWYVTDFRGSSGSSSDSGTPSPATPDASSNDTPSSNMPASSSTGTSS